jgi:undecaprenyl-diphosphatase
MATRPPTQSQDSGRIDRFTIYSRAYIFPGKNFWIIGSMLAKINKLDSLISVKMRLDHGETPWWKVVTFLAHSGDSWFWVIGLIIAWLILPAWRSLAAFLIATIVALAALVFFIKFVVRRSRPPGKWGSIYRNTDPHSFPSGHAARAAMLAVIAILSGPLWVGILMAAWALLVSLSRIMTGMHYFSDVLVGILLGIVAGQAAVLARPLLSTWLPLIF